MCGSLADLAGARDAKFRVLVDGGCPKGFLGMDYGGCPKGWWMVDVPGGWWMVDVPKSLGTRLNLGNFIQAILRAASVNASPNDSVNPSPVLRRCTNTTYLELDPSKNDQT